MVAARFLFFLYRTNGAKTETKIFTGLSFNHAGATVIFIGFIMQFSEHSKYDITHLGYSRIYFLQDPTQGFCP
jgi:hypothetical protein